MPAAAGRGMRLRVLYTKHVTRKHKVYHDGFLELTECGRGAKLITESGERLGGGRVPGGVAIEPNSEGLGFIDGYIINCDGIEEGGENLAHGGTQGRDPRFAGTGRGCGVVGERCGSGGRLMPRGRRFDVQSSHRRPAMVSGAAVRSGGVGAQGEGGLWKRSDDEILRLFKGIGQHESGGPPAQQNLAISKQPLCDANLPTVPESPKARQHLLKPAVPRFKRPRLTFSQGLSMAGLPISENVGPALNNGEQNVEAPFQPSCQGAHPSQGPRAQQPALTTLQRAESAAHCSTSAIQSPLESLQCGENNSNLESAVAAAVSDLHHDEVAGVEMADVRISSNCAYPSVEIIDIPNQHEAAAAKAPPASMDPLVSKFSESAWRDAADTKKEKHLARPLRKGFVLPLRRKTDHDSLCTDGTAARKHPDAFARPQSEAMVGKLPAVVDKKATGGIFKTRAAAGTGPLSASQAKAATAAVPEVHFAGRTDGPLQRCVTVPTEFNGIEAYVGCWRQALAEELSLKLAAVARRFYAALDQVPCMKGKALSHQAALKLGNAMCQRGIGYIANSTLAVCCPFQKKKWKPFTKRSRDGSPQAEEGDDGQQEEKLFLTLNGHDRKLNYRKSDMWVISPDPHFEACPEQAASAGPSTPWVAICRSLWHGPNKEGKMQVEFMSRRPTDLKKSQTVAALHGQEAAGELCTLECLGALCRAMMRTMPVMGSLLNRSAQCGKGIAECTPGAWPAIVQDFNLNPDQAEVVKLASTWVFGRNSARPASRICLVHGPFGSGKSTLLVSLIHLFVSPSHRPFCDQTAGQTRKPESRTGPRASKQKQEKEKEIGAEKEIEIEKEEEKGMEKNSEKETGNGKEKGERKEKEKGEGEEEEKGKGKEKRKENREGKGNAVPSLHWARPRVLVAAHTNVAVDRILLGLLARGFSDFVRVGCVSRIAKPVLRHSIHCGDGGAAGDGAVAELRKMLREATSREAEEIVRRELAEAESGAQQKRVRRLRAAPVVGVTCASVMHPMLEGNRFDVVILDEATQMTEPNSILPLVRAGARCTSGRQDKMPSRNVFAVVHPVRTKNDDDITTHVSFLLF
eukprot:evm.model.scf_25EXC.8 EVM.evm.TU.scf_25EXC.8   scf_25EXC:161927-169262(+)